MKLSKQEIITGNGPVESPDIAGHDGWDLSPDFLGLLDWVTIAVRKTEHDYEVVAELLTLPDCPCGKPAEEIKPAGTILQRLWDQPRDNRRVRLHFLRKRFKCPCGKNLLQPLAGVAKGRSVTERCAKYAVLEALGRSFDEVAQKIGPSSKTIKELFADQICALEATRRFRLPKAIGIDGVCVGRRRFKRSYCLITDLTNSCVLELLGKSTMLELSLFLTQVPYKKDIKIVVIDMSLGFLYAVQKCLPGVKIIIDPFHVLSKLNDCVNNVMRAKQKGLSVTNHKKLMKGGNRFLLLKRRFELTKAEKEKLKEWYRAVPEFKLAYKAKEAGFDTWKYSTSEKDAERRYREWLASIPEKIKPAFRGFEGMIRLGGVHF